MIQQHTDPDLIAGIPRKRLGLLVAGAVILLEVGLAWHSLAIGIAGGLLVLLGVPMLQRLYRIESERAAGVPPTS